MEVSLLSVLLMSIKESHGTRRGSGVVRRLRVPGAVGYGPLEGAANQRLCAAQREPLNSSANKNAPWAWLWHRRRVRQCWQAARQARLRMWLLAPTSEPAVNAIASHIVPDTATLAPRSMGVGSRFGTLRDGRDGCIQHGQASCRFVRGWLGVKGDQLSVRRPRRMPCVQLVWC